MGDALAAPGEPRELLERGLRAFFAYVREHPEGHAVLTRDAPIHLSDAGLGVMLDGLAARISEAIARAIRGLGLDPAPAPIYANALIGLGAHVGRWWRDHPEVSLADHHEPHHDAALERLRRDDERPGRARAVARAWIR